MTGTMIESYEFPSFDIRKEENTDFKTMEQLIKGVAQKIRSN